MTRAHTHAHNAQTRTHTQALAAAGEQLRNLQINEAESQERVQNLAKMLETAAEGDTMSLMEVGVTCTVYDCALISPTQIRDVVHELEAEVNTF